MDNFGFIHGELDTKILILFILRRLAQAGGIRTHWLNSAFATPA